MMKKELLAKNLGWGSYRGAVLFMYGIYVTATMSGMRGSPTGKMAIKKAGFTALPFKSTDCLDYFLSWIKPAGTGQTLPKF